MDEDTMKMFGFGEYPDWRWRCVMRHIKRIGDVGTAEEYFSGSGEEALLEDETLALFAFPYLRQRLYPDASDAMPEERGLAMMLALRAANEEYITSRSDSLNLEAGVLGGRARGELLVNPGEMTPAAQIVYERLFFDVRPFLGDTGAVCRLLFRDQERVHARGGYDLICKITAYALGFDEYQQWRCGSPSDRVHMLHFATDSLVRYLDGLRLLGLDKPDDMEKSFACLLDLLPKSFVWEQGRRRCRVYSIKEMEAVSALLPEGDQGAG